MRTLAKRGRGRARSWNTVIARLRCKPEMRPDAAVGRKAREGPRIRYNSLQAVHVAHAQRRSEAARPKHEHEARLDADGRDPVERKLTAEVGCGEGLSCPAPGGKLAGLAVVEVVDGNATVDLGHARRKPHEGTKALARERLAPEVVSAPQLEVQGQKLAAQSAFWRATEREPKPRTSRNLIG